MAAGVDQDVGVAVGINVERLGGPADWLGVGPGVSPSGGPCSRPGAGVTGEPAGTAGGVRVSVGFRRFGGSPGDAFASLLAGVLSIPVP